MNYQIHGGVVQIDEADIPLIQPYKWHVQRTTGDICYAGATVYLGKKDGKTVNKKIRMHRLLAGLEAEDSRVVDHRDRDGLNNQRSNLRVTCHAKNMANRKLAKFGAYRHGSRWKAQITSNRKSIHLGVFETEVEARQAYAIAARELHGEFTRV